MKKIHLFITTLESGGAQRVCINIANELANRGYSVELLVLNLKDNFFQKDLKKEINIINLNKKSSGEAIFILSKYLLQEKPQKILSFHPQLTVLLLIIKKLMRLKFFIIGRNITALSIEKKIKANWKLSIAHLIFKHTLKKVDLIIAQSYGMQKDLICNYNCNEKNIKVINNPVNDKITKYYDGRKVIKENNKEIMFIGRLDKQKGLKYLLEAMVILKELDNSVHLTILGEGPEKEEIILQIMDLDLNDNVKLIGSSNEVIKYYNSTKLVVLSSYYEGFPNVLIESIATGTPVVSFDCPFGPSEIIRNGENGYLAKYLNASDLADKIFEGLSTDWDYERIKEGAHIYSSKKIIDQYISVLEGENVSYKGQ